MLSNGICSFWISNYNGVFAAILSKQGWLYIWQVAASSMKATKSWMDTTVFLQLDLHITFILELEEIPSHWSICGLESHYILRFCLLALPFKLKKRHLTKITFWLNSKRISKSATFSLLVIGILCIFCDCPLITIWANKTVLRDSRYSSNSLLRSN